MLGGSKYCKLCAPKLKTLKFKIGFSILYCLGSTGINKAKRLANHNSNWAKNKRLIAPINVSWRITVRRTLSIAEQQRWLDWAIWICAKFQRTSSAVEGRNGCLSALHHSNRGFTPQTLKVLTIIHNFDIKRADDSTAAQRLFLHPFPDLFEWLVPRMGQLPRPRRTIKTPKSKNLSYKLSRLKLLPDRLFSHHP